MLCPIYSWMHTSSGFNALLMPHAQVKKQNCAVYIYNMCIVTMPIPILCTQ